MLNVLLVDDEKLERVLIRKGYNWEENGFNIVGEAASGEDALEYINYHNVDIVITDINMPWNGRIAVYGKIATKKS